MTGALISLVCCLAIMVLIISELSRYLAIDLVSTIYVDNPNAESRIPVIVTVELPKLKCEYQPNPGLFAFWHAGVRSCGKTTPSGVKGKCGYSIPPAEIRRVDFDEMSQVRRDVSPSSKTPTPSQRADCFGARHTWTNLTATSLNVSFSLSFGVLSS